ncbi:S-layer homology domain-containing protein [Oscillibacter sp.]|uniref:S-layer homology domain-containing protein n=1 Tax=Oscillibacter sp. TaxID=1945593 RepID=UPI002D7FA718|nr:S-layer homology domain-containing protein [Oscillibacter sp.]
MKKLFSLILVLALGISLALPALAAEEPPAAKFADVPEEHSFYAAIMDCAAKGITSGYADGTFRPASQVTRAQFCVMVSRAFYPDAIEKYNTAFNQKLGWFVANAEALFRGGVLKNTSFESQYGMASVMNLPISRYDMAQILGNVMLQKGYAAAPAQKAEAQAKITDYSSIPAQYQDGVKSVFALGIITGFSDGSFGGGKVMNRGQGCVAVYRMARYISTAEPVAAPEPEPEAPVTPAQPETSTTGVLTNGKPITEDNVTALMNELLAQWPNNTSFANGYSAGNKSPIRQVTSKYTAYNRRTGAGGAISITQGCAGWSALVSDYIFGQTGVTYRKTTLANARPGDLVVVLDPNGYAKHLCVVIAPITADHPLVTQYGFDWMIGGAACTSADDSSGIYRINNSGYNCYVDEYTKGSYDVWTCYPE